MESYRHYLVDIKHSDMSLFSIIQKFKMSQIVILFYFNLNNRRGNILFIDTVLSTLQPHQFSVLSQKFHFPS